MIPPFPTSDISLTNTFKRTWQMDCLHFGTQEWHLLTLMSWYIRIEVNVNVNMRFSRAFDSFYYYSRRKVELTRMTGSLKACLRPRPVLAGRHGNEGRRRRRRRKTRICALSLPTRRSLLLPLYLCLCLCPCLGVVSSPIMGDITIVR